MAVKQNDAEGGVDGVTPTTTDTGSGDPFDVITKGPVAGILRYSTAAAAHGALGYQFATRGTSELNYAAHVAAAQAASYFGSFSFKADDVASALRFCQFRESEAGAVISTLYLNATGGLTIREPVGGLANYTFTNTLALSTWYRIEYENVSLGGTSVTTRVRLYNLDSKNQLEDSGRVAITTGSAVTGWSVVRYGVPAAQANVPSATGFWHFDDIQEFLTDWPTPGPPIPVPKLIYMRKNF